VLKAISLRSVGEALDGAGARARAAGVDAVPAIHVADRIYRTPEEAIAAL